MKTPLPFLLYFLILSTFQGHTQHILRGSVTDQATGQPLAGATVSLHELHKEMLTDENGQFSFANLKPANYHLHISYVGYSAITEIIQVVSTETARTFQMQPTSIELYEVVVEARQYKTGAKNQTLAVEVLDADFLRKNRKGTFVNSLEDLPGINAINTGVGIAKPVIRGMAFNRVIVNDRGIKQEGQQWGTDHGLEIDMFDPGRVEIIKGPGALLYGSDGLGGVINITPPPLPRDSSISGEFQSIYKSNNHLFGASAMVEGSRQDWLFRARVSAQEFGDYRVPAGDFTYNSYKLTLYNNRLKNTAGKEKSVSVMAGVKKNWGFSTVTLSNFHQNAGLFAGAVGVPRSYQLTPDGNNRNIDLPSQTINHLKIISNTNLLIGKNWMETDIGYQHNYRQENSNPHAHGKGPQVAGTIAHGLTLQTFSLNSRYFQHDSESHSRIFGIQGEYQVNKRKGFEYLLPDFRSFSLGGFLSEEFSWDDQFTLNGGVRFDYASRNIEKSTEPIYADENTITRYYTRNPEIRKSFYNVSGALGLSYYPSRSFNAKVNLGTSFRVPTAAELSMNGIHHGTFRHELGDSTLTSERGIQADLSLVYQQNQFVVILTPFVSYYHNFIYLAPTQYFSNALDPDAFPEGGQIYQYRQHNAFYTGGELTIEYHPVKAIHLKSSLEYVRNYNLDTRLPLPFTPAPSVFTEVLYQFKGDKIKPNVGINYKWTTAQNRTDRNERVTPGYHLWGATAGAQLKLGGFEATLSVTGQNLLDTRYMNHLSRYRLLNLPEQGRNVTISLFIPF